MVHKRGYKGRIFYDIVDPIIPHFKRKDLLQVVVGASILAVPIGFTEETWHLGGTLPALNILGLVTLSLLFISLFTYHHYHHQRGGDRKEHQDEFVKRVAGTYILSFAVVAVILTLIQRAPWSSDIILAFKRIAIVTFPSSMSATLTDTLR